MKDQNDNIVQNEMSFEMNREAVKLNDEGLKTDRASYLAQERICQKGSPEYQSYVLESARNQLLVQRQIE